ncbi:MAG: hypothetical protein WD294_01580 [Phycisphaeraceae bacterium]
MGKLPAITVCLLCLFLLWPLLMQLADWNSAQPERYLFHDTFKPGRSGWMMVDSIAQDLDGDLWLTDPEYSAYAFIKRPNHGGTTLSTVAAISGPVSPTLYLVDGDDGAIVLEYPLTTQDVAFFDADPPEAEALFIDWIARWAANHEHDDVLSALETLRLWPAPPHSLQTE